MLNKIKIIGEVLPIKIKEENERKIDNPNSTSEEGANDFDSSHSKFNSEKERREP
ncbi:MAG: hypothetical protein NY202_04535 [Mollicutes bacterium UO1]